MPKHYATAGMIKPHKGVQGAPAKMPMPSFPNANPKPNTKYMGPAKMVPSGSMHKRGRR